LFVLVQSPIHRNSRKPPERKTVALLRHTDVHKKCSSEPGREQETARGYKILMSSNKILKKKKHFFRINTVDTFQHAMAR
jgi:hypothetical protein